MKRPIAFSVGVLLLVAFLSIPLAEMRFGGFSPQQLPTEFESRQGFDILASDFEGQGKSEINVVLEWDDGNPRSATNLAALYDYSRAVARVPHIVAVESLANEVPDQGRTDFIQMYQASTAPAQSNMDGGRISVLTLHVDDDSDSVAAEKTVNAVRALVDPPGSTAYVGGFTAMKIDTVDLILKNLPIAATFIIGSTIIILMVQVRSLVLPLKAVVMNLLSVAASFGVAVWAFQDGGLAEFLNFTPTPLEPGNLVLMFCIVFGLSMDYEVLLLSRMHEAYLQTGDNRLAVQRGLEASGRIITGAALIMVFVFGAFGIIRITFMKVIGVGLAFAILFDATIIRALLVPALMRMMGKWNWWAPRWMIPAQPVAMASMLVPAEVQTAPPAAPAEPVATVLPPTPIAPPLQVRAPPPAARAPRPPPPAVEKIQPSFADPAIQRWFDEERAKKAQRPRPKP